MTHTDHDCALTHLAKWASAAPGRQVIDIHAHEGKWLVSLYDSGGEPYQAHGRGDDLHAAVSDAIASYCKQRDEIRSWLRASR